MYSRQWFFCFITVATLWLTPIVSVVYSGLGISLYNLATPVLFSIAVLTYPWEFTKRTQLYFVGLCSVIFIIGATSIWNPSLQTVVSHILALLGTVSAAVLITRSTDYLHALTLVGSPVILLDLLAATGLILPSNTASPVLPIAYGGIGVPTSFGLHGIIVGSAVVSAFALLLTNDITITPEHRAVYILIITTGLLAIGLSQSRSSMLAVVSGIGIVTIPIIRRNRWLWLPSIFSTILGTVGGFWLIESRPQTISSRGDQIDIAANLVSTHPFIGIGWNRFYPFYNDHVLHFTPLNYGVGSGLVSLSLFIAVVTIPLIIVGRRIVFVGPLTAGLFGVFCVALVEILFFKSTPSVQLFAAGVIVLSLGVGRPLTSRSVESDR
ncbi:O-antigen ligase family protein [Halorubrum ezzemoulense]|uniref:O-antigen ligase family protein n=1 Tax=Halorubrum ezzemoulense TaxID=337243 RepID=UPI00111C1190|nr:O-antigen ligase family protein [Halorubrum ezzemoulense]